MPLVLVQLRAFRISAWITWVQHWRGCSRARGGRVDVSLRDVTIARDGKRRLASANDVTHQKRAEDFGRFWKSQWVEMRPASACSRRRLWRVPHVLVEEGRWKSQNRKIVPLSPYVEKPLNSKVIKSFVPEQRSRKCFSNFEIPMFYLYGHSMYVSHIAISWLWYKSTWKPKTVLFTNMQIRAVTLDKHANRSLICAST